MSDKRKATTFFGILGATVLAAGGSIFLTDTALSLVEKDAQQVLETEPPAQTGETELPLAVETFSRTEDKFVVKAKSAAKTNTNNTTSTENTTGTNAPDDQGEGTAGDPSGADDAPQEGRVDPGTMYAIGQVYVRSGAGTENEILGVLTQGEGVQATGNTLDNWIEVVYDGQTGYVGGSYLTAENPNAGEMDAAGQTSTAPGAPSAGGDGIVFEETPGTSGNTGGNTQGGTTSGGTAQGGTASGGTGTGGNTQGGTTSGGSGQGGSVSGGNTSNGAASGGTSTPPTIVPLNGTMYATTQVNVRSGPNIGYSRLGSIDIGERIEVTGKVENGWVEVAYRGQVGYVYAKYLTDDPDAVGGDAHISDTPGDAQDAGTSDEPSDYTEPDDSESTEASPNPDAWDDTYIYDVSSYYCDASEFDGWTATELAYLRNEIFARHGRIFTSETYRNYFSQKTWYKPTYDPDYFDANLDSFLNDYEWANFALIQRLEDERY